MIWTWKFRPETGEPGVLSPVTIPYFNTRTRVVEAVEIAALPIGYASFAASQTAGGTISVASLWGMVLGVLAGLGAGVALLGYRHSTTGPALRTLWRHYSPGPWWRLRHAAKAGDLLLLRRTATEYLRAGDATAQRDTHPVFAGIDSAIYRRQASEGFDKKAFLDTLRRAKRG